VGILAQERQEWMMVTFSKVVLYGSDICYEGWQCGSSQMTLERTCYYS